MQDDGILQGKTTPHIFDSETTCGIGYLAYIQPSHFTLFQMSYKFYHSACNDNNVDKSGHISSASVAFVTGLRTVPLL